MTRRSPAVPKISPINEHIASMISHVIRSRMNLDWRPWNELFDGGHGGNHQMETCRAAAAAVVRTLEDMGHDIEGKCSHEWQDWSNEHVKSPFDVCGHCGVVKDTTMRLGSDPGEFKAYMLKFAKPK
jgi:hypothetical protein